MATSSLNAELAKLRERGMVLPRHTGRAAQAAAGGYDAYRQLQSLASHDLDRASMKLGRTVDTGNYDSPEVQAILRENAALSRAMGAKRGLSRQGSMSHEARRNRHDRLYPKLAGQHFAMGSPVGGDVMNAIPRFYDPLEYWDLSGLPWNVQDEGHRHKLHKWLRLYYATHYLVPILVDIFTRFPLVGMELECKDPYIRDFYEDLFFDQLDYGEFLVSLGREFWVVGEAFPLGSFDEDLGVWEREELINPEDVVIENFPMLGTQQLKIVPPDYLKRLAQLKQPAKEYRLLEMNFPDLIPYLLRGEHIPISSVLLRQIGNKLNDWDDHGTPILLRGLRTLLHEEKLMASQDAIAERLYSPLILAKLGIQDMGDGMPPFIPGPEELDSVRDDFDIALSSDFRLLVHHFGLEVSSVFGREQMPRLGDDFDRIEKRLMQVFGVNPSLLSAGSGGQPYASSALQAEFLNQILKTFQNTLIKHFKERAMVVAEAQEHFDYEVKGNNRIPVYETIVEWDMEGNKTLREVPKLLIPDMKFQTLDLRDEATERQFLQSLRQLGVPIPDADLMVGIHWDIKDKIKTYNNELKEKTIAQQQAKMDTYVALTAKGLPVPVDLRTEVESVLQAGPAGGMMGGGGMGGQPGLTPGVSGPGEAPAGPGPDGQIMMPPVPGGLGGGPGTVPPGGGPPPASPMQPGPRGIVPEVSNERRPGLNYGPTASVRSARVTFPVLNDFIESKYTEFNGKKQDALGVPFEDYVVASVEDLDTLDDQKLEELYVEWPQHAAKYQQAVAQEVVLRMQNLKEAAEAARLPEDDEVAEDADKPKKLVLARNQELRTRENGEEYIYESKAKPTRTNIELPPDKTKYSIVDPEADPLPLEEPIADEPEST
jgi:hypothetical protein